MFVCNHFVVLAIAAASLIQSSFASPTLTTRASSDGADVERRDAIKQAFQYNYGKYVKYAFGKDSLDVVDKNGVGDGSTAGFGGTILDSLTTMQVMGMQGTDEYKNAMAFVKKQQFQMTNESVSSTPGTVKLFELTIRYIGGMLSAYQFNGEKPEERFLVDKAQELANRLLGSWNGSARIPVSVFNINTQQPEDLTADTNCAEAGTLTLEWNMLSKYTKDDKYVKLVEGSVNAVRGLKTLYPSLPYVTLNPANESFTSTYITLGGGQDSYFEYLIKYPVLLGQRDHPYAATYTEAMTSILAQNLIVKTGVKNLTFGADYDGKRKTRVNLFSSLACYMGGNVAMAGQVLGRSDWTQIGLELAESCAVTYAETALKLSPYGFGYADRAGNFTGWKYVNKVRREFYNEHGFFESVGYWFQSPETIESVFYAWRITGNQMWRDIAWDIFNDIKAVADTGEGWSGITNVNDKSSGIESQQQTFLYAELLKYMYLIFDSPDHVSLDDYVFNTEAHPFKRPKSAFGKIQGTKFPYKSIVSGSGAVESSKLSAAQKPLNMFVAQPDAGKQAYARELNSLIDMPMNVAMTVLNKLRKN